MANVFPPTTRRFSLPSSEAKYVPRDAGSLPLDTKRKCLSSGRNLGSAKNLLGSPAMTGSGLPPAPVTLYTPLVASGTNRMVPSRFQLPPASFRPLSATTTAGPPGASMDFSLPPAKNPSVRLSADQNGSAAPSVPGKARAASESRERTQSMVFPLSSAAEKARARPSGESAGSPPTTDELNRTLPGGVISAVMARAGARARRQYETALMMAARRKMTASPSYSTSPFRPLATASLPAAVTGVPPASAIHLSSLARSLVPCHRSSGSLARRIAGALPPVLRVLGQAPFHNPFERRRR